MLEIDIPGYKSFQLNYLVMDYNGTLAIDGKLIAGVAERLMELSSHLEIHVITADTFGLAQSFLKDLPVTLKILSKNKQGQQKRDYIQHLGPAATVAIGNGRNDRLMLKEAMLGIATIQAEGAAQETLQSADIVVNSINDALDLLLHKLRLKATLRD